MSGPEQHDNAGQLLVEIIRSCRDSQLTTPPAEKFSNPLLATAESAATAEALLGHMLQPGEAGPRESVIVNTVEVLLSLLEVRRPAPQGGFYSYSAEPETVNCAADIERQEAVVASTVAALTPRLPELTQLLLRPPAKAAVATTAGLLPVPLGKSRLALARLLAALLSTSSRNLNQALAEADTMTVLLDLFFEYSLNNFLHAQVEACVRSVIFWTDKDKTEPAAAAETAEEKTPDTSSLETPKVDVEAAEAGGGEDTSHPLDQANSFENPALVHLVTSAGLLDRLIKAWSQPSLPPTVAYMGHVTRISNDLVTACGTAAPAPPATPPTAAACPSRTLLLQLLAKLPQQTQDSWGSIVAGRLADTNTMNEIKPATDDKRILSSDDEDSDFRDIQFPQDTVLDKVINYSMIAGDFQYSVFMRTDQIYLSSERLTAKSKETFSSNYWNQDNRNITFDAKTKKALG